MQPRVERTGYVPEQFQFIKSKLPGVARKFASLLGWLLCSLMLADQVHAQAGCHIWSDGGSCESFDASLVAQCVVSPSISPITRSQPRDFATCGAAGDPIQYCIWWWGGCYKGSTNCY